MKEEHRIMFYSSAADRGVEYCDERVCLTVCVCVCLSVRDHISGTTHPIFTEIFVRLAYGRGSVLLWRRSDTLRTSGFMDDVILQVPAPISLSGFYRPDVLFCTLSKTALTLV